MCMCMYITYGYTQARERGREREGEKKKKLSHQEPESRNTTFDFRAGKVGKDIVFVVRLQVTSGKRRCSAASMEHVTLW